MGQHWRTLRALLRLTHPLPTLLNAIAAAALATVAGAAPSAAALVALTMLGVHTFIGATNDYIDRDRDAGRPEKPLARGQLQPRAALLMAAAGLTTGLTTAAQVSTLTLVLAALGALVGFTYNVWMKRSRSSPLSKTPRSPLTLLALRRLRVSGVIQSRAARRLCSLAQRQHQVECHPSSLPAVVMQYFLPAKS